MSNQRGSLVARSKQRQALRLQIQGEKLLADVVRAADELAEMAKEKVSSANVGALKASAELKLRVLDKVLPDLKTVEHDLGEGVLAFNDQELHDRINSLIARLNANGLLEGGVARVSDAAARGGETLQ